MHNIEEPLRLRCITLDNVSSEGVVSDRTGLRVAGNIVEDIPPMRRFNWLNRHASVTQGPKHLARLSALPAT